MLMHSIVDSVYPALWFFLLKMHSRHNSRVEMRVKNQESKEEKRTKDVLNQMQTNERRRNEWRNVVHNHNIYNCFVAVIHVTVSMLYTCK